MTKRLPTIHEKRIEQLYQKVADHIDTARLNVQRSVDTEMVKAYWLIGRDIVEEEQRGKVRSEYGSMLIKAISTRLMQQYGSGFSETNLKYMRRFYIEYPLDNQNRHALRDESNTPIFHPNLGWIHYRCLIVNPSPRIKSLLRNRSYQKPLVRTRARTPSKQPIV